MNFKQTYRLSAAAIATSLILAACGGGGGSGEAVAPAGASAPSGASSPSVPSSSVAPQTSVPTPSYAVGSFQLTAFTLLNNYREAMGVGELAQDPILDDSSAKHSLYLFSNLSAKVLTDLSHDEIAGNANFYAESPLLRAQKSGAPTTEYIGENVADGIGSTQASDAADCIGQALASVYHLVGLTSNQQTIGLGYIPGSGTFPIYVCTSDFGETAGVTGAPGPNEVSLQGGQQLPIGAVAHSPLASETGVALAMRPELENPAPDLPAPGRPILVRVNAALVGDILTVSQYTLTDSTGALVPARILLPASATSGSTATTVADPNNMLFPGTAILLPLTALKASTTYTVTFNGARDGSPVTASWSFATAAN
jgi:hypothetical protein